MQCIYCNSLLTVRNGHSEKGVQRYKCKDCGRRFCEKGIFARTRFPREIIVDALYLRSYPLSLRDVKRVLKKLKYVKVSHVSVYNWILKFYPKLIEIEKKMPLHLTKIWHVDEKFIKVRGSKGSHAYLWVVSDSKNNIIAVHVSNKRDTASAKLVLRKAMKRAGFSPEVLVSDGYEVYQQAKKVLGRKVKHCKAHFEAKLYGYEGKIVKLSNNKIERINGFFALWLHVCRGLKSFKTANLWLEFFAMHYNYLMPHGVEEKVKVQWEKVPVLINH